MADFEINDNGEIIRNNNVEKIKKSDEEILMEEFSKLEYLVLNNHGNPTKDPKIIARYQELKKQLGMDKRVDVISQLKTGTDMLNAKINNSVLTGAIENFKKRNNKK